MELHNAVNNKINPLHSLTVPEAEHLGKRFKKCLLGNKEAATAVEAWKLSNPILIPLFELPWFSKLLR